MEAKKYNTVDEYLNNLPQEERNTLENLRITIKETAPMAEEVISYQIPTYKYHGPLVHFGAFKDHLSLFVVDKSILTEFKKELKDFKTSGTTIHFQPEHPLPESLVRKIIEKRLGSQE